MPDDRALGPIVTHGHDLGIRFDEYWPARAAAWYAVRPRRGESTASRDARYARTTTRAARRWARRHGCVAGSVVWSFQVLDDGARATVVVATWWNLIRCPWHEWTADEIDGRRPVRAPLPRKVQA